MRAERVTGSTPSLTHFPSRMSKLFLLGFFCTFLVHCASTQEDSPPLLRSEEASLILFINAERFHRGFLRPLYLNWDLMDLAQEVQRGPVPLPPLLHPPDLIGFPPTFAKENEFRTTYSWEKQLRTGGQFLSGASLWMGQMERPEDVLNGTLCLILQ